MTQNPENLFTNVLKLEAWHIESVLPEQRLARDISASDAWPPP